MKFEKNLKIVVYYSLLLIQIRTKVIQNSVEKR